MIANQLNATASAVVPLDALDGLANYSPARYAKHKVTQSMRYLLMLARGRALLDTQVPSEGDAGAPSARNTHEHTFASAQTAKTNATSHAKKLALETAQLAHLDQLNFNDICLVVEFKILSL